MVCKALASLDYMMLIQATSFHYFNPQGSREPRLFNPFRRQIFRNFNPQGSREPRRISSTRLLDISAISIHKALASLDVVHIFIAFILYISIHKALASLDSKIIQTYSTSPLTFYALCSSLPSSTNSVHSPSPLSRPFPLFFRCESPWHFMLAWHSHLV